MQRTIKIKLEPRERKKQEILSTMKISEKELERRKKISKAMKGREGRKGKDNPMFGKHFKHSPETIEKISLASKGRTYSNEWKEKISNSMKGKKKSELTKHKLSIACKGKIVSDSTRKKISDALIGKKHSELTKQKISNSLTGRKILWVEKMRKPKTITDKVRKAWELRKGTPAWNKGIFHSNEQIIKIRKARAKQILPLKDTKIEIKIQNYLKELGIDFLTHQRMKEIEHSYQCDILIPSMNLVIECDGDYWHKYPNGNEIDHIRTKEMLGAGFNVLRLWETNIKKMDLSEFSNKIKQPLQEQNIILATGGESSLSSQP